MPKTTFRAEITHLPVTQIKAYDNNVKTHPDEQIKKLMGAIAEFGFTVPIIVDSKGVLIAGHGRLEAAKRMKIKEVPAIVRDDLTEAQARALRISDNRISESPWDVDALKEELEAIASLDFDLGLTGWDDEELDILLNDLEATEYEPKQYFGGGSGGGDRYADEGDGEEEGEVMGRSPQGNSASSSRYPLSIVLTWDQFNQWRQIKEGMGIKQDTQAFLKLLEQD